MSEQDLECPNCGAKQGHIQVLADDLYWCLACGYHFDEVDDEPKQPIIKKLRRADGE